MSKITFVAFKGKSFISKLIRFVTRSEKYSHIAYLSTNGKLIECWQGPGNWKGDWSYSKFSNHSKGTYYEIWELDMPASCAVTVDSYMHYMANKPTRYDYRGILGYVFHPAKHDEDKFFCSEGCFYPLKHYCKVAEYEAIRPERVSPQKFIELLDYLTITDVTRGVT